MMNAQQRAKDFNYDAEIGDLREQVRKLRTHNAEFVGALEGKTIIELQLCPVSDTKYIIDPTSYFIHGYVNIQMLEEFIHQDDVVAELSRHMDEDGIVKFEIWEDSDDYRSWYDFKPIQTALRSAGQAKGGE